MARVQMVRAKGESAVQRRGGVEEFRKVAREVNHIARLQLDEALLARLGQDAKRPAMLGLRIKLSGAAAPLTDALRLL
jgi:hypothetical protein